MSTPPPLALEELTGTPDFTPIEQTFSGASDSVILARAIERLAASIEQAVLTYLDGQMKPRILAAAPQPPQPIAVPAPPPAVQPVATVCPIHRQPWKFVPGGVSKKTGRPYDAFYACPERGCDQRPPA